MASICTNEASRDTVYAALELSKKNWVIGIARPERERPGIHQVASGNLQDLVARLRTAAKGGRRILVCYEAGYDGFWIARSLARENIECRVLDPASIQVNRRARRVKTDRIDVLALFRALIAVDLGERHVGEGIGLLEKRVGMQPAWIATGRGAFGWRRGPQGASQWRDYPRRSARARSFAP